MRRVDRQKGFSLIELMVGIVIGLMAIYATYRIFGNVEGNYRATETANEAQVTGLYATLAISKELSNAGAGIMNNAGTTSEFSLLQRCTSIANFPTGTNTQPFPLYPLPVAIIPASGSPDPDDPNPLPLPDEIFVFYGTESITDLPVSVSGVNPAAGKISLNVPSALWQGQKSGLTKGSVLITTAAGGDCRALIAQNAASNGSGGVDVTIGGGQALPAGMADPVIDLGKAVRRHFFVDGNQTLQMETWQVVDPAVGPNSWTMVRSVPIASNVVAFNAQYGVAKTADVNQWQWITPKAGTLGRIISAAPEISAQNIKAIRFGLIVRASEPDISLRGAPNRTETFFADCPVGGTCDSVSPITLHVADQVADQAYGWRYRKYETTVPLQNTIWNPPPSP